MATQIGHAGKGPGSLMANSNRVSVAQDPPTQPRSTKHSGGSSSASKQDLSFLKSSKSVAQLKKSPVESASSKGVARITSGKKEPKRQLNVIEEKLESQTSIPTDPNLTPRSKIVKKLQKQIKLNFLQHGTAPQT